MAYLDDFDDHLFIRHGVQDAVIALSNPVTLLRGEFHTADRPRFISE
jgi:hypothetical protein